MSLWLSLLGSTASTTVDLGEHCGGSTVAASTAKTFSSAFRAGTGGGLSWWCSHTQLRWPATGVCVEAGAGCKCTHSGGAQGQQQRLGPFKKSLAAAGALTTGVLFDGYALFPPAFTLQWKLVVEVCVWGGSVQVYI